MRELFKGVRDLQTLKKILGWNTLDAAIKNRLSLEVVEAPRAGKVLVLAPHPDDDIFGCGGTLAKHRDQTDEIRIIYLCDGRLGTKRPTTELVREEIKKTRKLEAIAGAETLGISPAQLTFWSYKDGQLDANKTTLKALTQVLTEYMPRTIYVPHPADNHPDHIATTLILAQTLKAVGDIPAEIWNYEVWQPTFANRLVPIGDVSSQKLLAIKAHDSQLKCRPFDIAIPGLNDYRGGMAGIGAPAEAFLALKPSLYMKLWELMRGLE